MTHVGVPVAAVALGVAGVFGGLEPVSLADRVEQVEPGAKVTVQPFDVTVKQAVAVDEISGVVRPVTPGQHLMVVLVDAENLGTESVGSHLLAPVSRDRSYLNRTLVVLDDRLSPTTASVYDADANVAVSLLNPGLTYRLALVWEFGGAVPERLPLGLAELTLRGTTVSPDDLAWQDPAEAATVTLPVRDSTGVRA